MEVLIVIGMAAAFLLGAYVRAPFPLKKVTEEKTSEAEPKAQKEEDRRTVRTRKQWERLLDYTGDIKHED